MKVGFIKPTYPGEKRVALLPEHITPEFENDTLPLKLIVTPRTAVHVDKIAYDTNLDEIADLTGFTATIDGGSVAYVENNTTAMTLIASPKAGFDFAGWSVPSEDASKVTITNKDATTTTAFASADVTITAEFTQKECTPLAAPTYDESTVITKTTITLKWTAVDDASSYNVTVKDHEPDTVIKSINTNELSLALSNLTPNTRYDYTIQTVGDGTTYCANSNSLVNYITTNDYENATLTLSENGNIRTWGEGLKENSVVALPTTASRGVVGKVFIGYDMNSTCSETPAYAPGANFTMSGTAHTLYAVYATASASGNAEDAVLVEMLSGDTVSTGDKLVIVANGTDTALYQETTNTSYVQLWDCSTLNATTVLADNKNWVTVTAATGGFKLGDGTNGYIYNSENNLYCGSTQGVWTLKYVSGHFRLCADGRYLSYRNDLGTKRWRMGGATYGTSGIVNLDLYKVVYYSNYGTTGAVPTGFDNIESDAKAVKVLKDGQIYILRGEKVYTIQGQLVK